MKRMIFAASVAFSLCSPAGAQEDESLAGPELADPSWRPVLEDAAWDWRPGDLIFRNGISELDEAMKRTFGLQWASVGIFRPASGGPRVLYVHQEHGVFEDLSYEHVEGLLPDEYVVYRPRDLNPGYNPEVDVMMAGPMARFPLSIVYGAPQDDQFLFGNGAFYNAELAYESALNAGIILGSPVRLRHLVDGPQELDPYLRTILEEHRYCRYQLSFDECWTNNLQDLSIITTDMLIASGALEQVYP